MDGQTSSPGTNTVGLGWGVRTTGTVSNPAITLNLDDAYSDLSGVSIWPLTDTVANIALGQNCTVWLHTIADFSADTSKVACDVTIRALTKFETYSQCPPLTGARYVTVQRFATSTTQLGLQEVRVYRSSELFPP